MAEGMKHTQANAANNITSLAELINLTGSRKKIKARLK